MDALLARLDHLRHRGTYVDFATNDTDEVQGAWEELFEIIDDRVEAEVPGFHERDFDRLSLPLQRALLIQRGLVHPVARVGMYRNVYVVVACIHNALMQTT